MANAVKPATLVDAGVVPGGGNFELWKVFNAEAIASAATVDSLIDTAASRLGFNITQFRYFGLHFDAQSSSGTADVAISLLESWDDTAANYVSPNVGGTISAAHGETAKVYSLSPVPMSKMRIRVVGSGSNPADTLVTAYLWMQS